MLHQILLVKLRPEVDPEKVEEFMVESRIRLLKIPEVMNLRCGKRVNVDANPHDFFISMDLESTAKWRVVEENAVYIKFRSQIIDPNAEKCEIFQFEMEPGKNIKYS